MTLFETYHFKVKSKTNVSLYGFWFIYVLVYCGVGVCCCMIRTRPGAQVSEDEMVRKLALDKLADTVAASVEDFVNSPLHRARVDPNYTPLWQKAAP